MYVSGINFTSPVVKNNRREQSFSGTLYAKRDFITALREMRRPNGQLRFNLGEINPIADNVSCSEAAEAIKKLAKMVNKDGSYRFNGHGLAAISRSIRSAYDAKIALDMAALTDKSGKPLHNCVEIEEMIQYRRMV